MTSDQLSAVAQLQLPLHDRFETRNQIFGGQLGAQAEMHFGQFFVNVTGKVLLGDNHESIDVQGTTTITPPPGVAFPFLPPVKPVNVGGFFAQGTNIGHRRGRIRGRAGTAPSGRHEPDAKPARLRRL